jgi:hypothetical protein
VSAAQRSLGEAHQLGSLCIRRAADLDEPEPDRRWLVESLWSRAGVGVIGGAPKCAKTWLALDLAVSVATGSPCLGRFDVREPGPVLAFFAEDSPPAIKERLGGLCHSRGLDLASVALDVITEPVLRLDLDNDRRRLGAAVAERRPRLLLLDPFVRLHRADENSAGDVSGLLAYLRALQREHDLAVVVVHHVRKSGPTSEPGQGLRGSGDFHAWLDSALYLRRKDHVLSLTVEHRAAPAPDVMTLELADNPTHLTLIDGAPPDHRARARSSDARDQLLGVLADATTPLTREALRAALRVRNDRLGVLLAELDAEGLVRREPNGWVSATVPVPSP